MADNCPGCSEPVYRTNCGEHGGYCIIDGVIWHFDCRMKEIAGQDNGE